MMSFQLIPMAAFKVVGGMIQPAGQTPLAEYVLFLGRGFGKLIAFFGAVIYFWQMKISEHKLEILCHSSTKWAYIFLLSSTTKWAYILHCLRLLNVLNVVINVSY